jgi:hypothetical protein
MKTKDVKSALVVLFLATAMILQAWKTTDVQTISIKVSPNVLNLENQGEVVTIHTDIAYYLVAGSTVTLNGVPIYFWKSDDRGNFVAKFYMNAIKSLPLTINGYNTLTLYGFTKDGGAFSGSSEIKVVQVIPKSSK